MTNKKEIELEQDINDIKEERELFGEDLDNYTKVCNEFKKDKSENIKVWKEFRKAVDENKKVRDQNNKDLDNVDKLCDSSQKGKEDLIFMNALKQNYETRNAYNKSFEDQSKSWDIFNEVSKDHGKSFEDQSKSWDTFDKASQNHKKSCEETKKAYEETKKSGTRYDPSGRFFNSQRYEFEATHIFLSSLNKTLLTKKQVNESQKELWTRLNQLLEIIYQYYKKNTNILKLKEQKEFVKDCFKKFLTQKTKTFKENLNIANNEIDDLNSKIMKSISINELLKVSVITFSEKMKPIEDLNESLAKSGEYRDKSEKSWSEFFYNMMKIDKGFGKEKKEMEQQEKILKKELLNEIKKMFNDVIQLLKKESKTQDIYQDSLKVYEEIERFYVLLG